MSIQLDDPIRDLVNYSIEAIESVKEHMPRWNKTQFLQNTQHFFSTISLYCPDDDIRNLGVSAYILAGLDIPRLAMQKLNWAAILNLERESEK